VLDRVISAGGYAHLILAGNPQMAWRFRNALPHHLSTKFIEVIETSCQNTGYDIVTATIAAFLEREQEESLGMVESLLRKINTSGLALAGPHATMGALQLGIVDVIIMLKSFDPKGDLKDRMVKMAEMNGCKTEIVDASDALGRLGGVGCLLRYKVPTGSETGEYGIPK
jgi:stalled ribosome rescue protein Dom34